MARLQRSCHRLIWLDPLAGTEYYQPLAGGMAAAYPYIDDLGNEIRLSFDYYENQFDREVDEVFLSGGGARLVFLEEALEKIFEKKTTLWNPVEHLRNSDRVDRDLLEENASQLAIAMGLASRLRAA